MNKPQLIQHLRDVLLERMREAEHAIATTRAAFASDTKSSAGDKHETGRAMVQQELDKLEEQLFKLLALRQELDRVPLDRVFDRVAFGSLVGTDQGTCFVCIGLGRLEFAGEQCFAISLASPMGQALSDKRPGDTAVLNGKSIVIREIR